MFSGPGPVSGLERQVWGREVKNFVSLPFSKLVRSTAHSRRDNLENCDNMCDYFVSLMCAPSTVITNFAKLQHVHDHV
jgi:hypothetical protein